MSAARLDALTSGYESVVLRISFNKGRADDNVWAATLCVDDEFFFYGKGFTYSNALTAALDCYDNNKLKRPPLHIVEDS